LKERYIDVNSLNMATHLFTFRRKTDSRLHSIYSCMFVHSSY